MKRVLLLLACLSATLTGVVAAGVPLVTADFSRPAGEMKPLHGVGQPPMVGRDFELMHYLQEAGIPFSRLHDVGGYQGRNIYVDIPNLFRDFEADENDPANYDFAFTDRLLAALVKHGVEPFFRLGVTIENGWRVKVYRTYPPKDFAKWARICEHVVRHYTEGWADGYRWKIRYWEIWNEPDNNPDPKKSPMWTGTWQQYLNLYETASKHLKKCFPHLKIGGYASCGFYAAANSPAVAAANASPESRYFVDCFLRFLQFVKERNCPLDFFSFHSYSDVPEALRQADWCLKTLRQHGFGNVETSLNEWLPRVAHENLGTALQASAVCAEMIGLQKLGLDSAMIYDARCGVGNYSPLFNPMTYRPHKAYYALKAFNEAYRLKTSVRCKSSDPDVYALAAGRPGKGVVLIANISKRKIPLGLDMGGATPVSCELTDADRTAETVPIPVELPPESFVLVRVR